MAFVANVVTFGVGPAVTTKVVAAVCGSAVKVPIADDPVPFVEKVEVLPVLSNDIVVFVCGGSENVPVT